MAESRIGVRPALSIRPLSIDVGPTQLLALVFFVSGCPALIYQLVWQRALFTIYGVNMESITVVVAAFMLGLGLGSLAGGALSKRPGLSHLVAFAFLECCIAIYGLCSLPLLRWAGHATLGASLLATGLLTFSLVLVPTAMMGATLPILVSYLVKRSGNVGHSVGLLYFVNTLGSAFACFAVAWWLMGALGMSGTVQFAAALNVLVGGGAFVTHILAKKAGDASSSPTSADETSDASSGVVPTSEHVETLSFRKAVLLSTAVGFISLSYEILWSRVYSFASASRATAFPFMLGSYLAGIAFGSLAVGAYCKRLGAQSQLRQLHVLGWYLLAVNLLGLLSIPAIANLALKLPYQASYVLVTIVAGGLGAALPLISHLGIRPDSHAGARLSFVYLGNILGSTSGSLITGFWLMDRFGIGDIATGLAITGCVLAALLLISGRGAKSPLVAVPGLVAVITAISYAQGPLFDRLYEKLQYKTELADGFRFKHVVETKSGVITVTEWGTVFGGGIYDGRFNTDLVRDSNNIIRPYSLSAFHPAIQDVLVIGVSSGSWTQVLAHHPDVQSVTAVEINPGYFELMAQYDEVKSLLHNPKVHFSIDDGRRWLNANPGRKFDAIVMNTTYHWRAYSSNLLSVEFLELIRQHLKPGGFAFYNTTSSPEVQQTAVRVFPHALRVLNFMLVSDSPIQIDRQRLEKNLKGYRIDDEPIFNLEDPKHAARFDRVMSLLDTLGAPPHKDGLESRESVLANTANARVITDDNMGTEWLYDFDEEE